MTDQPDDEATQSPPAPSETFDPRLHLRIPSWSPAMFDIADWAVELLPTGQLVLDGKPAPLFVVAGSSAVTNGANRASRRRARR